MSLIFTDRSEEFVRKNKDVMDSALSTMADDGTLLVKETVPIGETGKLSDNTTHRKLGIMKHRIQVETPYAAYQEAGKRKDGTHIVKKYTTPNTGKGFLRKAGDYLEKNALEYLKQAVQKFRKSV